MKSLPVDIDGQRRGKIFSKNPWLKTFGAYSWRLRGAIARGKIGGSGGELRRRWVVGAGGGKIIFSPQQQISLVYKKRFIDIRRKINRWC